MKKYLLFTAALFTAATGFAQNELSSKELFKKFEVPAPTKTFGIYNGKTTANVQKSVSNGVYYVTPKGTFYSGPFATGSGYIYSMLMIPPHTDLTFENMVSNKANSKWTINSTDVTSYAVDGNYVGQWYPEGSSSTSTTVASPMYYVPTLSYNGKSYMFGDNNYYVLRSGSNYTASQLSYMMTSPTLAFSDGTVDFPFYITNPHGYRLSGTTYYSNTFVGYGVFDTGFLFGSGKYTSGSTTYEGSSFTQACAGSAAPLYVEDIFTYGVTLNDNGPIPANDTLYMYITDVDTVEVKYSDGSTALRYQAGDKIIATLYAAASDTVGFTASDALSSWNYEKLGAQYKGKTAYSGSIIFHNTEKTVDPLIGTESNDPVVIPENKAFAITVTGFDKTGVNFGVGGIMANDEDVNNCRAVVGLSGSRVLTYSNNINAFIGMTARFEKIHVPSKGFLTFETDNTTYSDFPASSFNGWNVLRVSADGQTVSTDGLSSSTKYNVGYAFVATSSPWNDTEGNPYYDFSIQYVSGGEDWISNVNYDTQYYKSTGLTGYNTVKPVCSALPAGVTGRAAKITVIGRGNIPSDDVIYVLQGDADFATGIKGVEVDNNKTVAKSNKFFNLSGQQVGKEYKGIVINNGKKFVR